MNKIILMGYLGKDPEVRYSNTASGSMAVANFSLGVNRKFKRDGEPSADFFNCTAFGKTAETVEKYLRKGTKILVVGRIQNDNYTNKDGQKMYSTKVMVDEIEFCESKSSASNTQTPPPAPANFSEGFMNIPEGLDNELPFV